MPDKLAFTVKKIGNLYSNQMSLINIISNHTYCEAKASFISGDRELTALCILKSFFMFIKNSYCSSSSAYKLKTKILYRFNNLKFLHIKSSTKLGAKNIFHVFKYNILIEIVIWIILIMYCTWMMWIRSWECFIFFLGGTKIDFVNSNVSSKLTVSKITVSILKNKFEKKWIVL